MWVLKLIPTLFKFKQSATLDGDDRDDRDDGDDREDKAKTSQPPPTIPIFPIIPIIPINSTSISKINFSSEGCRVRHSAKIPTMGCTKAYCSLSGFFVRGRNRPLITANNLLLEGVGFGLSQK